VVGERRYRAAVRACLSEVWCVVRPHLSSPDRLRMAISENQMRENLTQADRVAALDALDALVEDAGLRSSARALGISPGWLSRQLSLRRDPVLFPALEAGQVSFAQADEIRRAPVHLRQTLVDRAVNEHLPSTEIRTLVASARAEERRARSLQCQRLRASSASEPIKAALEVLLTVRSVNASERPLLLGLRETADRLLEQTRSQRPEARSATRAPRRVA
jgi:ParB-like chromosome segregation protein Spo0J